MIYLGAMRKNTVIARVFGFLICAEIEIIFIFLKRFSFLYINSVFSYAFLITFCKKNKAVLVGKCTKTAVIYTLFKISINLVSSLLGL